MEQTTLKTEEQATAPREWVTPTFEREPLNEALGYNPDNVWAPDGSYGGS